MERRVDVMMKGGVGREGDSLEQRSRSGGGRGSIGVRRPSMLTGKAGDCATLRHG